MAKQKLKRILTLDRFSNVIQNPLQWKGRWDAFFGNSNPITLELGCGKAEISLGLAEKFPQRNFLGIDVKGARLWVGARNANEKKLQNIAFMRMWAERLPDIFSETEVSEIWITYPDPFRKRAQEKRRLTSSRFLKIYRLVLSHQAKIHVKTDDLELFRFSLKTAERENCIVHTSTENLYLQENVDQDLSIPSHYEKKHLAAGRTIKYLCFSLKNKFSAQRNDNECTNEWTVSGVTE
jgi:tRNA (guanine-N7-)-methyltransferase